MVELFWKTTEWLHMFRPVTFGDGNMTILAYFRKRHSQPIWDTWNSPINSLCEFTLQMFLNPGKEQTVQTTQPLWFLQRLLSVAKRGRLRSPLSHRWASNYMRKTAPSKCLLNVFIPAYNTYSRIAWTAKLSKVSTFQVLRTKVPIKRIKRIQQSVFCTDASASALNLQLNVKLYVCSFPFPFSWMSDTLHCV